MVADYFLRSLKLIGAFAGVALSASSALGSQAQPYFHPWRYSQEQFMALPALKQLELHNRCIVAATYAMVDARYAERNAKSVYFFHLARAENLTRAVPYGQRERFNQSAGSVEANKGIYRSLGWTRVLKSTISSEMESCTELSGLL